jgi:hypothetical protein
MKIKITSRGPDVYGEGERYVIEVDGAHRVTAGRGEPEDNCLGRDLSFVYDIVPLMQEAYEAGKRGDAFEVEKVEEDCE